MTDFKALGLSSSVLKALTEMGFEQPTDIQKETIPLLLSGDHDLIGLAQTGTGKTAAFGLPLLELIDYDNRNTQALILAPTRELAQQISVQLEAFSKYAGKLNTVCVYGGASIQTQISQLRRGAQIIVATPGRLIDLTERKAINLSNLEYLVLDEADEMLNMGFKDELDRILQFTPEHKLTWLFSATMPAEIRRIIKNYMHNPQEVKIDSGQKVNKNISHQHVITKASDKPSVLKRFLDFDPDMYGVVFCRTKRDTQMVADVLADGGYPAEALHGDMSQAQRDAVMKRFRAKQLRVLVATDVAARGIDVDNLTHVIHYALPDDAEYYTHRSGRTARAGKKGISLSLITRADKRKMSMLENKLGINFEKAHIPSMAEISTNRIDRWAHSLHDRELQFDIPEASLKKALEIFSDFSKEQLIEKMVARELLKIKDEPDKIQTEEFDKRGKGEEGNRERRRRDKQGNEEGMQRYFVGLGSMDDFNKGKLLKFLCDNSKLSSRDIGRITVQRIHSFFDVDVNATSKVSALKSLEFNGRKVRVNRDDEYQFAKGDKKKKKKKKGRK